MVAGVNLVKFEPLLKILNYQHQGEEVRLLRPRLPLSYPVQFYNSARNFHKYSFLFRPGNRAELLYILTDVIPWFHSPEVLLTQLLCGLPFAENLKLETELFEAGCGVSVTFSEILDSYSFMAVPALKPGYDIDKALNAVLQNFW